MYGPRSPTNTPSPNNRIEPSFFHTSNSQKNSPKKQGLGQEPAENPYWPSPPPYSERPSASSNTPSAPPLDLAQANNTQPIYPPIGYNHPYPTYGSTTPYPNTSDAPSPSPIPPWPWAVPPSNTIPPPPPSRGVCSRFCKWFWYLVIALVFFGTFSRMFESTSTFRCTGGATWESLPEQIEFGSILRISGSRGISTGRIILQDATEEIPKGTIHLKGMVAPSNELKRVHFSLKRKGDETHLDFQVVREGLVKICVSIEVVVYVAKETRLIHLDLPNVAIQVPVLGNTDTLQISTSNSPILFDSAWKGKRLLLNTSNSQIQLLKPIEAEESVMLCKEEEEEKKVKKTHIIIATSNGAVIGSSTIEAKESVHITTSNAHIHLKELKTNEANLINSNGAIILDHSTIGNFLNARTSNGRLTTYISGGNGPRVIAKTSNAQASVYMSDDFEGSFTSKTSSYNSASLVDELGWSNIKVATKGFIMGDRSQYTSTSKNGSLLVETSNADVELFFINQK